MSDSYYINYVNYVRRRLLDVATSCLPAVCSNYNRVSKHIHFTTTIYIFPYYTIFVLRYIYVA